MTYSMGVHKKCGQCYYYGTHDEAIAGLKKACQRHGYPVYPNERACDEWKQRMDKDQLEVNYNSATGRPDKKHVYGDEEKVKIFSAITEAKGDMAVAIALIIEWRDEDKSLAHLTKPKLQSFIKSHYEEMCQFVASTKGLEVAFNLLDDVDTPATVKRAIRKDIEDRGFGAPTQKVETKSLVITLSDLIKQRGEEKETIPAGEWSKDDKVVDGEG